MQHKCAKFNLWRQAARTPSLTCALQPRITPRVTKTENSHRYTSIGTILDPKLTSQDRKQAQTPDDPPLGLLQTTCYDKVIMPERETSNDLNESARVIHEYTRKLMKYIIISSNFKITTSLLHEPLRPSSSRDGCRTEHASSARAEQL